MTKCNEVAKKFILKLLEKWPNINSSYISPIFNKVDLLCQINGNIKFTKIEISDNNIVTTYFSDAVDDPYRAITDFSENRPLLVSLTFQCPVCFGDGYNEGLPCTICDGTGWGA